MSDSAVQLKDHFFGGKGASLSTLAGYAEVPDFRILNSSIFDQFLIESNLGHYLKEYWKRAKQNPDDPKVYEIQLLLQKIFLQAPFSNTLESEINEVFTSLDAVYAVARSSASVEDGISSSWAGQFSTFFGINNLQDWQEAVRNCWAAIAKTNVVRYSTHFDKSGRFPSIAIILQKAVDAICSGVVFSNDPTGSYQGPVLEATWGLGGPLVSGKVTPETWRCHRGQKPTLHSLHRGGRVWLLEKGREKGPAVSVFCKNMSGDEVEIRSTTHHPVKGIWRGNVSPHPEKKETVLNAQTASTIFSFTQKALTLSEGAIELEWAIDRKHRLWWLQKRPVTVMNKPYSTPITPMGKDAIAKGMCGSAGIASGPFHWFEDGTFPESTKPILFKESTDPADVPLLLKIGGLATMDGGILCHSAIVSRELGIPCIVNTQPFPPDLVFSGNVTLDAEAGLIKSDSSEDSSVVLPRIKILNPPTRTPLSTKINYLMEPGLKSRIPQTMHRLLQRILKMPGVIGDINVLPDFILREHQKGLGFPIGIAFQSERYHPTAAADMGDGFSVLKLNGIDGHQVVKFKENIMEAISTAMDFDQNFNQKILKQLNINKIFSSGLDALKNTEFEEQFIERVEENGVLEGGDALALSPSIIEMAKTYLTHKGEAGHFMEVLLPGSETSVVPDYGRCPYLVFHTGSIEVGLEFLNEIFRLGYSGAHREGVDSPDMINAGLYGLDITKALGRKYLAGALGLCNYAYVRRTILKKLVEQSLQKVFGKTVRVELQSDVMHTCIKPNGETLLYQQGTQLAMPCKKPVPILLTGAPKVVSYLLDVDDRSSGKWCPHGKVYLGHDKALENAHFAKTVEAMTLLEGPLGMDQYDIVRADAQIRESLLNTLSFGHSKSYEILYPLLSIRGTQNGKAKIRK